MDTVDVGEMLQEVQAALHSLVNTSSSPAATGTNSATSIDYYNEAILGIENMLQRLVVLQLLLSMEFLGISQVIQSVRTVMELNAAEDEAQRQLRRRGRPEIVITRQELQNLLNLQFTQVEISKLYGCSP